MPRPRGGAVSNRTGETNGSSSLNHTHREWSWPPTLVDQFPGKAHTPRKGMENPPHRGLVSSTRIWRDRQGKAVPLTQPDYPGSELEYIGIFICTCVFVDSLRSQTVNALRPSSDATVRDEHSEDDITLDPLIVLRCDSRVFRSVTSSSRVCQVLWRCWLGVRKSIRPVQIEWWGVDVVVNLSGVRCRLFAYGPADAKTLSSLASFKLG